MKDPDGGQITTLGTTTARRFYSGPQFTFTDVLNGISFRFHSPVEAFVTDPLGRRCSARRSRYRARAISATPDSTTT